MLERNIDWKKETLVQFWHRMAVSAAWLLGSSVLLQVNHEVALLWVSSMVLLFSCEASWPWGGPEVRQPWGKFPLRVCCLAALLILVWSCHFLSARLHLHTKKCTLEKGPLWVSDQRKGLWSSLSPQQSRLLLFLKHAKFSSRTLFFTQLETAFFVAA